MERKFELLPAVDEGEMDTEATGVQIRLSVVGPLGAVVFTVDTQWHSRPRQAKRIVELRARADVDAAIGAARPLPVGVNVYSRISSGGGVEFVVEGSAFDTPMGWSGRFYQRLCTLDPDALLDTIRVKGHEGVFAELEREYMRQFGGVD
jgi:hypothetical protein